MRVRTHAGYHLGLTSNFTFFAHYNHISNVEVPSNEFYCFLSTSTHVCSFSVSSSCLLVFVLR